MSKSVRRVCILVFVLIGAGLAVYTEVVSYWGWLRLGWDGRAVVLGVGAGLGLLVGQVVTGIVGVTVRLFRRTQR